MESPYINTVLYTNVTLRPNQMNNNIYLNLKTNLINMVKGKNFGDYGYIVDIYEILKYSDNRIEAENTMASAIYDIKFSCRLCKPLKQTKIICQVEKMNKVLLRLKNGPIYVIVTNDRINEKIFFKDNNRNLRYKQGDRSVQLSQGDYVKVTIMQLTFNSGDRSIMSIGFLEDIATEDEIKKYHEDEYNNSGTFVDYDEYMKSKAIENNKEDDVIEENDDEKDD